MEQACVKTMQTGVRRPEGRPVPPTTAGATALPAP